MIENIRLSFQGIWSHKMRSILTMLGIIIGIAAIIAIVSTIQGTNEQIKQNMLGNSGHTVKVSLYQDDMEYSMDSWTPSPDGIPVFDGSAKKEILKIFKCLFTIKHTIVKVLKKLKVFSDINNEGKINGKACNKKNNNKKKR